MYGESEWILKYHCWVIKDNVRFEVTRAKKWF